MFHFFHACYHVGLNFNNINLFDLWCFNTRTHKRQTAAPRPPKRQHLEKFSDTGKSDFEKPCTFKKYKIVCDVY